MVCIIQYAKGTRAQRTVFYTTKGHEWSTGLLGLYKVCLCRTLSTRGPTEITTCSLVRLHLPSRSFRTRPRDIWGSWIWHWMMWYRQESGMGSKVHSATKTTEYITPHPITRLYPGRINPDVYKSPRFRRSNWSLAGPLPGDMRLPSLWVWAGSGVSSRWLSLQPHHHYCNLSWWKWMVTVSSSPCAQPKRTLTCWSSNLPASETCPSPFTNHPYKFPGPRINTTKKHGHRPYPLILF